MRFLILEELGIDDSDAMSDPWEFTKRIDEVGKKLLAELDRGATSSDLERTFEEKACKNEIAREKAKAILDRFLTEALNEDAEVCANIMDLLPEVSKSINAKVKSMGVRAISPGLSKRQLHAQYIALKAFYGEWIKMAYTFFEDKMPAKVKAPIMKAKPGNYSERFPEHGAKNYRYYFEDSSGDNDYAIDPWFVANKLGITIKKWADLSDMIKSGKVTNVRMVEY